MSCQRFSYIIIICNCIGCKQDIHNIFTIFFVIRSLRLISAAGLSFQRNVTIAAAATSSWAAKVFPQLAGEMAVNRLWDEIFQVMRLDHPAPVEAWQEHSKMLRRYCRLLNNGDIVQLHFRSGLGTDLTVPLAEGAIWCGGCDHTADGIAFQANMPTEEVFTMPHRNKVSGRVVSSMPLSYQGNLIRNFSFTFLDGAVVEYSAEEGGEALETLLGADEGSRYLGEVALVPYTSPVRRSGLLFYHTLLDENASCHLALGSAYPSNMKGCLEMDRQQRADRGFNESVSHVDFMFGTQDLQVVAQRHTDPVLASMILSLESVFSVLAGWALLGEVLSARELAGCLLVFAAIVLVQLPVPEKQG